MIKEEEVFRIGKLLKPHGIKGEISFAFDNDVFDKVDCPYLICLIDGLFIPFFIEEYRFKGKETALITFEDINSEEKARKFNGVEVYFPRTFFDENDSSVEYSWNYFVGFKVFDNDKLIGTISAVDKLTINVLFIINNEAGDEILIPASEDFIVEIDDEKHILKMQLPEGLL